MTYMQFIWQIFLLKAYCYFKEALAFKEALHRSSIVISKKHLRYIWVVPSLFQEVTCSDLVFSRVLCFLKTSTCRHHFLYGIELIRNYSYNHPFNEWPFFYYKRVTAATNLFKFTVFFAKQDLYKGDHKYININYDTSLVSSRLIYWKKSVIGRLHFQAFFLW